MDQSVAANQGTGGNFIAKGALGTLKGPQLLIYRRDGLLGYVDQFPILPNDAGGIGLNGDFARALRSPFDGFFGAEQIRGRGAFFL